MMNNTIASRRTSCAVGSALHAAAFSRFGMMNALAQGASELQGAGLHLPVRRQRRQQHGGAAERRAQYNAYKTIRGSLALPDANAKLLPVTAANGTPYALNDGLALIQPLWAQRKLAVVANVGMLVQPTTRAQYVAGTPPVPTNLFSHADQVIQMQAGNPYGPASTGWAGRVADAVQPMNGGASFPPSVSVSGPALFRGQHRAVGEPDSGIRHAAERLQHVAGRAAATREQQALQQMLTFDTGLTLMQAADKVRQDAIT